MALAGLKKTPPAWFEALAAVLAEVPALRMQAVVTAQALDWGKQRPARLLDALKELGTNATAPVDMRLPALAALPDGLASVDQELFELLRQQLKAEQPVTLRGAAADVFLGPR